MVFDYERHDTNFSEDKILEMQKCFSDVADMGKLYLNYPMIESYQHLRELPDDDYRERKIPVSLQPGKEYKKLVRNETVIAKAVEFPHKIGSLLKEYFGIEDGQTCRECYSSILNISNEEKVADKIQEILQDVIEGKTLQTAKYQFEDLVIKLGYAKEGQTYWEYMRGMFCQIILHNICKANWIQNGCYDIETGTYRECFENLDMTEILREQNRVGQNIDNGYIWVLNTCVLYVAEYNFSLIV